MPPPNMPDIAIDIGLSAPLPPYMLPSPNIWPVDAHKSNDPGIFGFWALKSDAGQATCPEKCRYAQHELPYGSRSEPQQRRAMRCHTLGRLQAGIPQRLHAKRMHIVSALHYGYAACRHYHGPSDSNPGIPHCRTTAMRPPHNGRAPGG
eukprot:359550-Chlamydomonas_euryale.AAC.5